MKPTQIKIDKYKTKKIEKTSIKRLDEIIKKSEIKRPSMMKLDVQGYELEVLKGSKKLLKNIDFIITEISFKRIYKNQTTRKKLLKNIDFIITEISFKKIYKNQVNRKRLFKFLNNNNFKSKKMLNISKVNNKLFQADVLFAKNR